jgi:hypothetical protein
MLKNCQIELPVERLPLPKTGADKRFQTSDYLRRILGITDHCHSWERRLPVSKSSEQLVDDTDLGGAAGIQ